MDLGGNGSGSTVKKQEDDDKGEKRDVKPVVKTLNRVPRTWLPHIKRPLIMEHSITRQEPA
jgi:hypothetical protein